MDKFRIGQKVKLVRPTGWKFPDSAIDKAAEGQITFISGGPQPDDSRFALGLRWEVEFISPITRRRSWPLEIAMVPLYDGDEPASWETCAWRPRDTFQPTLPERLCDLEFEPRAPSS